MIFLFPFFIITTLVEIYFLIKVGETIGALSTILLIILTALLGSFLLKYQGIITLNKAQQQIQQGIMPTTQLLEGVVILISGVLLLTPGFVTDMLGLLGLIPWTRTLGIQYFIRHYAHKYQPRQTHYTQVDNNTIEGEFWQDK